MTGCPADAFTRSQPRALMQSLAGLPLPPALLGMGLLPRPERVHWRLTGGFTGLRRFDGFLHTGAKGIVQGVDRLTIQGGKIDASFVATEMARAIGLMPPAGQRPRRDAEDHVDAQARVKRLFERA